MFLNLFSIPVASKSCTASICASRLHRRERRSFVHRFVALAAPSGGTAAQRRLLLVYQLYWPPARGGAPLAAERKAPRGRVEHHHDEQLDALRGLFPPRRGLSCATPRAVDRRVRGGEAQETLIRKRR